MRLGLHYANFTHPEWEHRLADRLVETAKVADQGGVDLLTVMDHWFQMETDGGSVAADARGLHDPRATWPRSRSASG